MAQYTLLAHKKDGRQALVQHDTDPVAYLYRFRRRLRLASSGVTCTYQRVTPEFTVSQDDWVTEYHLDGNHFDTVDELRQYLCGYVGGLERVDA